MRELFDRFTAPAPTPISQFAGAWSVKYGQPNFNVSQFALVLFFFRLDLLTYDFKKCVSFIT